MKISDTAVVKKIKNIEITLTILLSTGLSCIVSTLLITGGFYPYHISIVTCNDEMIKFETWHEKSNLIFEITIQTFGFVIPLILLIWSNTKILLFVSIFFPYF
jgi:hypothetical protein